MKGAMAYLMVGGGTALGSLSRYALSSACQTALGLAPLWGTLLANALGSCLIGWLSAKALSEPQSGWARYQPFWISGFCAGFTTFSLFSVELLDLYLKSGWRGGGYALASVALWLLGTALGGRLGRPRA